MDNWSLFQTIALNWGAILCLGVVVGILIAGNCMYVRNVVGEYWISAFLMVLSSFIFIAIAAALFWKYLL